MEIKDKIEKIKEIAEEEGNHSGYAHAPDEIFEVCVKCNI